MQFTNGGTDDEKIAFCLELGKSLKMVNSGDIVIATSGSTQVAGGTNLIRVMSVA